jgi:ubiquinol-cytochrome c reductase cytochrome b subunit
LLVLLLFQGFTGILLSLSYSPSADSAHASVRFVMEETVFGGFIRGLHYHGTNFTVAVLILCGLRIVLARAYSNPREFQWMVGIVGGIVVLAIAITGYLLPWDQYGYWGTQVRTSIMGSAPGVGPYLKTLVLGGRDIGNLTLTRFYTAHAILLPAVAVGLIILYLKLGRRNSILLSQARIESSAPYWPVQASRDVLASLAVVVILFSVVVQFPIQLGDKADPLVTYPARPEWYFLWLFQLLKYFQGPLEVLGTAVIPQVVALVILLLPLLDRSEGRAKAGRALVLLLTGVIAFGWAGLSGTAVWEDYRTGHFKEVAIWNAAPDREFDCDGFYKARCVKCHGRDGSGYIDKAPDFTSTGYWSGIRSDVRLVQVILEGVPDLAVPEDDRMPSFAKDLTPSAARAMVQFKLRKFAENQ